MSRRIGIFAGLIIVLAILAVIWREVAQRPQSADEIRLLAWVGYDEADYVTKLEARIGKKIAVQTYGSGDQMYNLLSSAPPGTYDVVIVDAEFGRKLFSEGKLLSLDRSDWHYEDAISKFQNGAPAVLGNTVFGVVARWGAIGLVYNTTVFSKDEVQSYSALLSPKARGRVGIFDWYLPNMGAFAKSLGFEPPYNLTQEQLQKLSAYMRSLRPQVVSIQAETGAVIDDLRSGRTAIVPGIGEWASALLQAAGKPIDYIVPKEGGIMWVEAFAIPASAQKKQDSLRFIRAAMEPESLALLASRRAYFSQLGRRSAYQFVPDQVKRALHSPNGEAAEAIASTLEFRQLPGPATSEAQWLDAWNEFKSSN